MKRKEIIQLVGYPLLVGWVAAFGLGVVGYAYTFVQALQGNICEAGNIFFQNFLLQAIFPVGVSLAGISIVRAHKNWGQIYSQITACIFVFSLMVGTFGYALVVNGNADAMATIAIIGWTALLQYGALAFLIFGPRLIRRLGGGGFSMTLC